MGMIILLTGVRLGGAEARDRTFFIQEYLVEGVHRVPSLAIQRAVYPYLGPDRTAGDVERARAAVEAAYRQRGYQTVTVQIPAQAVSRSVRLVVNEVPVGRLRVRGARYSAPSRLKAMVPSLAEGKVVNFNDVPRDIVALNELPDRRVTPAIHQGVTPGTLDVDLDVKETSPVHASVELNNRRGPDTVPLRLNVAASDNNITQSGQAAGFSFQNSPQKPSQVKVLSGYYLARFPSLEGFRLMVQGTKQDSNVSTLGSVAVAGRGQTFGVHGNFDLPSSDAFVQSASVGLDYKHFNSTVNLAATGTTPASVLVTPITYYPLSASYSATWLGSHGSTDVNTGVTFNLRTASGSSAQFENNRFGADSNFIAVHGDASRTQNLFAGFQAFGKVQGQLADQPLVNSEQLSGGGLGTVRGYLEAEALGDSGLFGTLELRSPSLLGLINRVKGDWRLYAFFDGGFLSVNSPLPNQASRFTLDSYGVGTRIQLADHFDGSVDAGMPLKSVGETKADSIRVTFRAALSY